MLTDTADQVPLSLLIHTQILLLFMELTDTLYRYFLFFSFKSEHLLMPQNTLLIVSLKKRTHFSKVSFATKVSCLFFHILNTFI